MRTGLIGHGYWGKIIEQKLIEVSEMVFIQTSKNYNPEIFNTVDWIFIVTPTSTHFNIAKDCILAGVNVFLEKPATETAAEYLELIELSQQHNTLLYISNVFLFRKELFLKKRGCNWISFFWYKKDGGNFTLIDNLLYHDLYILITVVGDKNISGIDIYINHRSRLLFTFMYGEIKVYVDYSVEKYTENLKEIHFGNEIILLPKTQDDPLKTMINKCLTKEVDFNANYELNFKTLTLMDTIKQK